jgi:predicted esterase YcpF (UPF0227 family)
MQPILETSRLTLREMEESAMQKLLTLMAASLGGWLGWWLGARVGMMTGFFLSVIGMALGVYAAQRITRDYLG